MVGGEAVQEEDWSASTGVEVRDARSVIRAELLHHVLHDRVPIPVSLAAAR
jgi:hypothetical protein